MISAAGVRLFQQSVYDRARSLCGVLPLVLQADVDAAGSAGLYLPRQLIGNHDEITDLVFLYSGSNSSNSEHDQGLDPQQDADHNAADAAGTSSGGLVLQPGEPSRIALATNSHDIRLFDLSDASCVGACVGHRDIVLCLDTVRPSQGGLACLSTAVLASCACLVALQYPGPLQVYVEATAKLAQPPASQH